MEPRDILDIVIYVIIVIGLIWAGRRFYMDMKRPLPPDDVYEPDETTED